MNQTPLNTLHINADGSQWWVERPHATGVDIGPAHYSTGPLPADELARQIDFYRRVGFNIDDARTAISIKVQA